MRINKKFELIRQESSFNNEEFYKKYIEPETIDITRHLSTEKDPPEETKYDFDEIYDMDDDLDGSLDDLDALLLSSDSIPMLKKK
jgi:hypothetical protein